MKKLRVGGVAVSVAAGVLGGAFGAGLVMQRQSVTVSNASSHTRVIRGPRGPRGPEGPSWLKSVSVQAAAPCGTTNPSCSQDRATISVRATCPLGEPVVVAGGAYTYPPSAWSLVSEGPLPGETLNRGVWQVTATQLADRTIDGGSPMDPLYVPAPKLKVYALCKSP